MILSLLLLQAVAVKPSNWIMDTHHCMQETVVEFEKSGEAAATVADAALSKCDDSWLAYRSDTLSNRPANAVLSYQETKEFLDDIWSDTAKRERASAIQKVVEIRAARAKN